MRTATTAVIALLLTTVPAFSQTAAEKPPFSLNFGPGVMGDTGVEGLDVVTLYSVGADIPLSARWTLRSELGGRWPRSQRSYFEALYAEPNPAAPNDPRRAIRLRSDTTYVEDSLADAALLVRFGTPASRRFQVGALAGPHVELVRTQTRTLFPRHDVDPANFEETSVEKHHMRAVFEVGLDAGVRVDDRWTLVAYALAGLSSPADDNDRRQVRGGVLAKWSF